ARRSLRGAVTRRGDQGGEGCRDGRRRGARIPHCVEHDAQALLPPVGFPASNGQSYKSLSPRVSGARLRSTTHGVAAAEVPPIVDGHSRTATSRRRPFAALPSTTTLVAAPRIAMTTAWRPPWCVPSGQLGEYSTENRRQF